MNLFVLIAGTLTGSYPSLAIFLESADLVLYATSLSIQNGTFFQTEEIGSSNDVNLLVAWNASVHRQDFFSQYTQTDVFGVVFDATVKNILASFSRW